MKPLHIIPAGGITERQYGIILMPILYEQTNGTYKKGIIVDRKDKRGKSILETIMKWGIDEFLANVEKIGYNRVGDEIFSIINVIDFSIMKAG